MSSDLIKALNVCVLVMQYPGYHCIDTGANSFRKVHFKPIVLRLDVF